MAFLPINIFPSFAALTKVASVGKAFINAIHDNFVDLFGVRDHYWHRDSFGTLQSVLVGAGTWTLRLVRSTKIVLPHIAKNDDFSYICQFNHDKIKGAKLDDMHLHITPIGTVVAGNVIALDYKWAWLSPGDIFPNTLPNTGTVHITLATGDQYKELIKAVVSTWEILSPLTGYSNMDAPINEEYSSKFMIELHRRNDAQDTYAGEFAISFGDLHYPSNRPGSYNEVND